MTYTRPSKLTLGAFFGLFWVLIANTASAQTPPSINYELPYIIATTTIQTIYGVGADKTYTYGGIRIGDSGIGSSNILDNPTNSNNFMNGSLDKGNFTTATSSGLFTITLYTASGAEFSEIYGYFNIFWSGTTLSYPTGVSTSSTPTIPINKNIEILNPTYGTTTATTTFQVKINFKTPFSIDFRPTTTRHYEIVDAVTGELNYSYSQELEANSSENLQLVQYITTSEGSKYIRAMYLDLQGNIYSEVDEVFFNVATNTYYANTGLLTPRDNPNGLTQIDCGTFEFGCQFQKALTFLFVPSNDVLDKFKNLWQTIAEKKPFGYVTVTINQLKALDVSGSSAFTLGTIPFMDSLFTPFRTAVATILWALFAIYFYQRRLKHLDI